MFSAFWLAITTVCALLTVTSNEPLCSSPTCRHTAEHISNSLNLTIDPCDDFYHFSCGGWQTAHSIPDTESTNNLFDSLNRDITSKIKELLENYDLEEEMERSPNATSVSYAAYVYQRCMQLGEASEETGLRVLKEVVSAAIGLWNIGQDGGLDQEKSWHESFVEAYVNGAVATIFNINIVPDSRNSSRNIIKLTPASLGIGDNELKNLTENAKLIDAYRNFIKQSAMPFCTSNCSTLDVEIDELINFESRLALAKMSAEEESEDAGKGGERRLKVQDLHDITQFDWLAEVFTPIWKLMDVRALLNKSTIIEVDDLRFFVEAIRLLQQTSPRTVANLVGWRIVAHNGPKSSETFRQYAFQFDQVYHGVKQQSDRWQMCYNFVGEPPSGKLSMAVSRLFLEEYFSPEDKAEAIALVESIQEAFRQQIRENSWLDDATRNRSFHKLNSIKKNVAYPEELLDNDKLDQIYGMGSNRSFTQSLFEEDNYLLSVLRFQQNENRAMMASFDEGTVFDDRWLLSPATVNAVYFVSQNSITIPAAILRFPFFTTERPDAINFGFLGAVIAHEFTHALDDMGRQFDEAGNRNDWWTEDAERRFHNQSECFVEQYGKQVEPMTGMELNGKMYLGENIADNGGIRVAFRAFKSDKAQQVQRLASLERFSPEQLFFISYANAWCQLYRPEAMKLQIQYDSHAPGQYRVNIPLSNSPDFASAFNCSVGSRMNPTERCSLW